MTKLATLSIFEFQEQFKTDDDCKQYLYDLKWKDKPFSCRKCGNSNACKSVQPYTVQCSKCRSNESATAGTLFHKCKFSMLKAFHIIYFVSTTKGGMSAAELGRKLALRTKTAWLFKRKVMQAMKSSEQYPMEGDVVVDEFFVGGKDTSVKGRKSGSKRQVVIAVEKKGKGVSRVYARVIEHASKAELLPFIRAHVATSAHIKTDKWSAYKTLKAEYPNHTAVLSENGSNFNQIHRCIMMMKAWLRGVHHSVRDLQAYLDEYTYRYNRHLMNSGLTENLLMRMVTSSPLPYSQIAVSK